MCAPVALTLRAGGSVSPCFPGVEGVEGVDEGIEFLPGNDPLHFGEELFPLCGLLVFFESGGVRERFLAVHRSSSPRMVWSKKQFP